MSVYGARERGCDRVTRPFLAGARFARGRQRGFWRWFIVALTAALCLTVAAVANEQVVHTAKIDFDIPAQPLVTALQVYSEKSGVQVMYESESAAGRRSSTVKGEFTREEALKVLLGADDLIVRYARADAVVLLNPADARRDEPPEALTASADIVLDTLHIGKPANEPDRNALADYISVIQQDVQQALRKRGKATSGSYRVGVELWVDPSRTIRKTEVFQSTGDRERDVAVAEALQGVVIRQAAPAYTPQPVRVMIVVRSL
jgi:hypothetical protein